MKEQGTGQVLVIYIPTIFVYEGRHPRPPPVDLAVGKITEPVRMAGVIVLYVPASGKDHVGQGCQSFTMLRRPVAVFGTGTVSGISHRVFIYHGDGIVILIEGKVQREGIGSLFTLNVQGKSLRSGWGFDFTFKRQANRYIIHGYMPATVKAQLQPLHGNIATCPLPLQPALRRESTHHLSPALFTHLAVMFGEHLYTHHFFAGKKYCRRKNTQQKK